MGFEGRTASVKTDGRILCATDKVIKRRILLEEEFLEILSDS
jgi:hypothetical protein